MKNKSFRLLWMGQLFANLGDVFYIVGLISILYKVTESALYLALLPFLNTFGRFLSGFLAPLLLNKYRLQSLLFTSQLYKTILLLFLACWISFNSNDAIWLIFICILSIAFLDGWALPATDSMLPRLVDKSEIMKANSFIAVLTEVAQLGGWAAGGILVVIIGDQRIIWLTFILFVASTLMMKGIQDSTPFHSKKNQQKVTETLKEGWMTIWNNPLFRSIHIQIFIESISNVIWVAAILYVFVSHILHVSETWWGYINTAFFTGLVVGGIISSKFSTMIESNMRKTMLLSSFIVSLITFLFGLNTMPWIALILVGCSGLIDQIKGITLHTYIQKEASIDSLPKIYSAQSSMNSLVFGVSSLGFGWMAENFGIRTPFMIAAILLSIGAIILFFNRKRFPIIYS